MQTISAILALGPVVPVLTIDDVETAVPLARALAKGGLPAIEVTLRTAASPDAIRAIAAEVPEAVVGAGTILTPKHYEAAVDAGARFIVSPGCTPDLVRAATESEVPFLPGAATASEVMSLMGANFTHMKFFPAGPAGGVKMLAALAAPLPAVRFCPTGGVTLENAPDYLALPNVACVGGSWVAPADAVKARDWGRIEELARAAAALRK
ncbi:bifunctional 4-hydroxy-2-oxoglutarate aldolase/2-dehydro-3-deoxy-phosphogluconate aldolase [Skermanella rosea]|uniref:bifunctional 4-hydroxy-2-oxoglutarate aldolase/2-dehydro-3-deoxy-phosphogluconate aldolase n=1 Tax=Skermanella rosea TaxID=1817965 RepID=UPI001931E9D0|nr:bifunctional 4-hydroxy-2-oxoglutarate aldolase/2-dehydro-3-deoxy-phosphogluconate aldolase [Skermanella rosea]UEM05565.1 bifunctional 4-hydroxy-2-oxoglutarate aldolase/2-dehydro-3-deoxy-phosphogluconate aldolase [Skermanella rosea]